MVCARVKRCERVSVRLLQGYVILKSALPLRAAAANRNVASAKCTHFACTKTSAQKQQDATWRTRKRRLQKQIVEAGGRHEGGCERADVVGGGAAGGGLVGGELQKALGGGNFLVRPHFTYVAEGGGGVSGCCSGVGGGGEDAWGVRTCSVT